MEVLVLALFTTRDSRLVQAGAPMTLLDADILPNTKEALYSLH